MVEQITLLRRRYGIRQIQFYDDTFTVAKKNVLEFCRLMVEQRVDVTWTAYVRGDCFNHEMAAAMKRAGCHQVLIGIETADPGIMRNIGKPIDTARYAETVTIAHAHGIEVRGSFIIGNVGETHDTMRRTLAFAKDLDLDLFQLSISAPYPGTQLYRYAATQGLLVHRNWSEYGQGKVLVRLPDLTPDEIYAFERYAFRSFYLRPRMVLRQFRRVTSARHLRDLFMGLGALVVGAALYRNPKWDCWKRLRESDFQDLPIAAPDVPRLTYALRQETVFS
ncbi:MAG: radical SAM protein [Candidatus Rokubacteria bacterium]|nr:radical SAM protein [Candidatus Rokubacteria bacterium]